MIRTTCAYYWRQARHFFAIGKTGHSLRIKRRPHHEGVAAPVGAPWMWTLAYGHHKDRTPTHGYEPTREAAMAAFAKSWRRE